MVAPHGELAGRDLFSRQLAVLEDEDDTVRIPGRLAPHHPAQDRSIQQAVHGEGSSVCLGGGR